MSRRDAFLLTATVLLGLALRAGFVTVMPQQTGAGLYSDMDAYDRSAWAMTRGEPITDGIGFNGWHPLSASTYYHVGYTWFVAAVYAWAGHRPPAVYWVQAVLSAATVPLVWWLARQCFSPAAAHLAALLTAVYLPFAYYACLLLTETPFIFLQTLALTCWVAAFGRPDRSAWAAGAWAVAAGLAGGLAATVRTAFVPTLGLLPLVALFVPPRTAAARRRRLVATLFAAAAATCILPVTVRNWQIHGRFILLSTNGPSTFYTGRVVGQPALNAAEAGMTDAQRADLHRRIVWEFLRTRPLTYLNQLPFSYRDVWLGGSLWPNTDVRVIHAPFAAGDPRPWRVDYHIHEPSAPPRPRLWYLPDAAELSDRIVWLLLGLPLGLWALALLPKDRREWTVVLVATVPYLIVPAIASPFARYRMPVAPLVFVLAGHAAVLLLRTRRQAADSLDSRSCATGTAGSGGAAIR